MKENESKQNQTKPTHKKHREYHWSDDEIISLFNECAEWLLPYKIQDKNDKIIDIHEKNIFVKSFLMQNGLYNTKLLDIFRIKTYIQDYYDDLLKMQEYKLADLSLNRKVDSTMAKFTLSSKHDWKEKTENTNKNTNKNAFDLKSLIKFK
jgi:hypothetical protein